LSTSLQNQALIVGLGNPGLEYAKNRHNVGFQCIDRLAANHGLQFSRHQAKASLATGTIAGRRVILAKPLTYMNLSGQSVAQIARFYKIAPADILVVCDDLDLPLGRVRLRPEGSSAGHRGMTSIIDWLGTDGFPRMRLGIGRPAHNGAVDFVLGNFSGDDAITMDRTLDRAVAAVVVFLTEGIDAAMNQFNAEPRQA
jgi:PTH1 family peptidyl-tRNA hydrolase